MAQELKKVTESALVQRLNRKLGKDHQQVKLLNGRARSIVYGHKYALVDTNLNTVIASTDDLEEWAREEGLLGNDETLIIE